MYFHPQPCLPRSLFLNKMVLSCAQPCIQGLSDPEEAATMAINVNNQLAADISNNTLRFGGFASLAMHNATVAARELKRTVTELGFLGALINDYQQSGPDNGMSRTKILLPMLLLKVNQKHFFTTTRHVFYDA